MLQQSQNINIKLLVLYYSLLNSTTALLFTTDAITV